MNTKQTIKTAAALLSPLLLFVVLPTPYSYLNGLVLVKWLGCGCPKFDAAGNMISPDFNANHFTMIFWAAVISATGSNIPSAGCFRTRCFSGRRTRRSGRR